MEEIARFSEWQKIGSVYGVIGLSELILYPLVTLKYFSTFVGRFIRSMELLGTWTLTLG